MHVSVLLQKYKQNFAYSIIPLFYHSIFCVSQFPIKKLDWMFALTNSYLVTLQSEMDWLIS